MTAPPALRSKGAGERDGQPAQSSSRRQRGHSVVVALADARRLLRCAARPRSSRTRRFTWMRCAHPAAAASSSTRPPAGPGAGRNSMPYRTSSGPATPSSGDSTYSPNACGTSATPSRTWIPAVLRSAVSPRASTLPPAAADSSSTSSAPELGRSIRNAAARSPRAHRHVRTTPTASNRLESTSGAAGRQAAVGEGVTSVMVVEAGRVETVDGTGPGLLDVLDAVFA